MAMSTISEGKEEEGWRRGKLMRLAPRKEGSLTL